PPRSMDYPGRRRHVMRRLTSTICGVILGTGIAVAFAQPVDEAQKKLLGAWTATRAQRDGEAVDDVVGHRLTFTGNRFQIQSPDRLTICDNAANVDNGRPTTFEAKSGSGYVL